MPPPQVGKKQYLLAVISLRVNDQKKSAVIIFRCVASIWVDRGLPVRMTVGKILSDIGIVAACCISTFREETSSKAIWRVLGSGSTKLIEGFQARKPRFQLDSCYAVTIHHDHTVLVFRISRSACERQDNSRNKSQFYNKSFFLLEFGYTYFSLNI